MAKKLLCFPFKDGNLLEYVGYDLDDSERERVYAGETVITKKILSGSQILKLN